MCSKIKRILAIAKKESLEASRDISVYLIAFFLPLLLLFLMGYAVSLDPKSIKFSIYQENSSKLSKEIINEFMGLSFFDIEVSTNKKDLLEKLENNKIRGFLVIGANFEKDHKFQLITDASEPNISSILQNYTMQTLSLWAKKQGFSDSFELESRYYFNEELSSRYFLIPGSIAVVMTLIATLLTALVVAKEWEKGTMESLMVTPISTSEIIFGKIIPYFILALFSALLCFFVAYFWYEIPFRGSFLIFFALCFLYLLPSLSSGLLISVLAKNQFVAAQAALMAGFLPAFLLSGFIFEIKNMPFWVQNLTYIFPARYFVRSLQSVFLAGDVYEIFIEDMIYITALGVILFAIVIKKLKKGLE